MTTPINKKPKRGAHRNRKAGHSFELTIRNMFKDLGYPHLVTSRSESRSRDDQKIDLINKDEYTNGRFPYNVQCKNTCKKVDYDAVLKEMPASSLTSVIIHKMTSNKGKDNKQGKFVTQGHFAIMSLGDFMKIVAKLKAYEPTMTGIPTIDRQTKKNGTEIY